MKKRKVYIVDDEKELLEIYTDALSDLYDVVTFSSPRSLIEAVEVGAVPDVFVTDIKMAEMDGIQLIEWARSRKIERPFVIISGYSEKSHAIRALKLGAVDLIEKPFPVELLKGVVRRAAAHSLYQQLQNDLLARYRILSESLIDLARNYEARSLVAERELRSSLRTDIENEKMNEIAKSTRESVILEKIVGVTQEYIHELTQLEDEVKVIMGSVEHA